MSATYLTTDQLAEIIHYDARTIRTRLKDVVLLEGVHYIRPFGGRKLLFIWEAIQRDIGNASAAQAPLVPMANGDVAGRAPVIPMAKGGMAHG
ncbi:MAG: hypothetical protein NVS9B15_20330 [Acidobacteriaceae bacterium]